MTELTKKQKKHLRELTDIAYERDMSRCLEVLTDKFEAWKKKEISTWDLNQKIHEYHNEIARELYKSYTMNDPIFTVAFGVAQGVISLNEVDQTCREIISSLSDAISRK
jgi:hypothetical protein